MPKNDSLPWALKYKPKSSQETVADDKTVNKLKTYLENYKSIKTKKRSLLLHGPTGCGKTSLIYAIASEMNYEILEVNASDSRNKKSISALLGNASKQMSLFARNKIILVDEIDGLSGTYDRGGVPELVSIINNSSFPIIMTGEDPWASKFSKLRSVSTLLALEPPSNEQITNVLEKIAKSEEINYQKSSISFISRHSNNDLRGAINDLQSSIVNNRLISTEEFNESIQRDITKSIPQTLQTVFKCENFNILKDAFANFQGNFDDLIMWIEYNLPDEYPNNESLANAFDYVSLADVFNGRIRKWQYWRFLVYINLFLSCGVGKAKNKPNPSYIKYKQNSRPLKIWMSKRKNAKKDAISQKIAAYTHNSKKEIVKNFEFYKHILKNKNFLNAISQEVNLEKDEIEWLKKA